jgi:large subunit ribosomal protein L19
MTKVISPVNIESRKNLDLRPGDTVRVYQKIQEKGKTRLQAFEGMVLARKHGTEAGATFTVRRNTGGYGVEKIFPLYSPIIDKIEIVKRSKVRRSKLYYIREKALKQAKKRLKMMFVDISTEDHKEEEKPENPTEGKEEENAEAKPQAETVESGENKVEAEEAEEKKEEVPAEDSEKEEKPETEEEKK